MKLGLFSVLCGASAAYAHTTLQWIHVNGVSPGHDVGIRYANNNSVRFLDIFLPFALASLMRDL